MRDRRALVRGSVDQVEFMYAISRQTITVPEKAKLHFSGTNNGNYWGPIQLDEIPAVWHLTFVQKKQLYGVANRVLAGGPGPEDTEKIKPRNNEDSEPVTWHGKPQTFYEEVSHCYNARCIVMLCGGDLNCAMACIDKGSPASCRCRASSPHLPVAAAVAYLGSAN